MRWTDFSLFIHLSVREHLGSFQLLSPLGNSDGHLCTRLSDTASFLLHKYFGMGLLITQSMCVWLHRKWWKCFWEVLASMCASHAAKLEFLIILPSRQLWNSSVPDQVSEFGPVFLLKTKDAEHFAMWSSPFLDLTGHWHCQMPSRRNVELAGSKDLAGPPCPVPFFLKVVSVLWLVCLFHECVLNFH